MKILINIACFLFAIVVMSACDEEETQMFDQEVANVNFYDALTYHSFSKSGNAVDTVEIKFYINGIATDYVRSASLEIVQDSTSAVEGIDADFSIVSAEVLPNEFSGIIKVRVNQPTDDLSVYFRFVDGDDFTMGLDTLKNHKLILTNRLTPPNRWNNSDDRYTVYKTKKIGTYSTAYYKFIIASTGDTEIPYPWAVEGYKNNIRWTYDYFTNVWKEKLKSDLAKYNESIAPDVLLHDDGPAKGLPVIVGHYYTFD